MYIVYVYYPNNMQTKLSTCFLKLIKYKIVFLLTCIDYGNS